MSISEKNNRLYRNLRTSAMTHLSNVSVHIDALTAFLNTDGTSEISEIQLNEMQQVENMLAITSRSTAVVNSIYATRQQQQTMKWYTVTFSNEGFQIHGPFIDNADAKKYAESRVRCCAATFWLDCFTEFPDIPVFTPDLYPSHNDILNGVYLCVRNKVAPFRLNPMLKLIGPFDTIDLARGYGMHIRAQTQGYTKVVWLDTTYDKLVSVLPPETV